MTNLEELEALIRRNVSLAEARVDTRSLGQWKQALGLVEAMGWKPTVRHIKRGSEYEVVCAAKIQTDRPLGDYAEVTVYRGKDGVAWVRPIDEFEDPMRFEDIS